jgi:hypothetical protein
MKSRIVTAFWFFAALVWIILGVLYLIRLHDWFKGSALLALGIASALVGLRFRKGTAETKSVSSRT